MGDNATPRTALIAYGSETGNAHEVADELGHLAERLHFTTHVSELNAVQPVGNNMIINRIEKADQSLTRVMPRT